MADYSIRVIDKDSNAIGEFVNFTELHFSKRLNDYGECTFKVPLLDMSIESLIALRRYEVQILREGSLVWAGEQVSSVGDLKENGAEMIDIVCRDYIEMFANKHGDFLMTFSAEDAGQIAWELIEASQDWNVLAFLGVTEGTIEATQDRDRTYYFPNVYKEVLNLSNVIGGFDFEITDLKVFNVYERKGLDKSSSAVFEWGTNIQVCKIEHDFTNPINYAVAFGEGVYPNQLRQEAYDIPSATVYGFRDGDFYHPDVSVEATLLEKAEAEVEKYKQRIEKLTFKQTPNTAPFYGSLVLGDLIRIKINYGIYNINNIYRIYQIKVDVDVEGTEIIEYFISLS